MTTASTAFEDGLADRCRRAFADTWTITLRALHHWRNRPGVMVFGWLFPVLLMVMFIGLLGGALGATTGGGYVNFILPGAFAMAMFFGLDGTMAAVSSDASKGVTDRFRSLPMSGVAIVAGRCTADLINSVLGLAVVALAGLALGWRPHAALPAIAAAFGVLLLLRFAMLWIGVFIGLKAKNQEAVMAVQVAVWPLLFLSSVFVDTATMPRWLGAIAEYNPLSTTTTAVRELFGNPVADGSFAVDNALAFAVAVPVLLIAVFLPLSASGYRHLRR